MRPVTMTPIGIFHTDSKQIPRHWAISDVKGDIVIDEKYKDGLKDIQTGQKIIVIFHFHQSPPFESCHLIQKPWHREKEMGVFSICSPLRPNPIGLSVLKVLEVKGNVVSVVHADMVDGTPVLDIKPYTPGDFKE
ncbi:MAG: tRNA (N6-threonylcarbamoyladenosine(37)-N6)-methyltransferase TrmO [Desulfobacterales bacterium]|jgi:tRNA-Thr(GGU) m(6)t(6)A37 methyltransferase TsaA|nr:tRNA (N6-threonylcarbamoyladenosine(37)-N6)-methyltransferase TrmO [Desulfobacterales bacterium]